MRPTTSFLISATGALLPLIVMTADTEAHSRSTRPSLRPQKVWTMPWQLSLASTASRAKGERTYLVRRSRYGVVRGTPVALRYLSAKLPAAHGRNTLVKACRATVAQSARKIGPVRVEAASAGPQRRTRSGYVAPVGFRLIYARFNGREAFEVRQGVLTCVATRSGKITNAYA